MSENESAGAKSPEPVVPRPWDGNPASPLAALHDWVIAQLAGRDGKAKKAAEDLSG